MKKQLIQLALFGFPIGVTIGYAITLVISIIIGNGLYYPVNTEFITTAGGELNAVLIQTLLSGIVGSAFSMGSLVWDIDSWSLAKQTGVYFAIACVALFPISYYANWMPHSVPGAIFYVGMFVLVFVLVWIAQYMSYKKQIAEVNARIKQQ